VVPPAPAHGPLPAIAHTGSLGGPVGLAAATGVPPAYEKVDVPATGKKPCGKLTWTLKLVATEQTRSKSTW